MPILQRSADAALAAGKGVWLQCFYGHFRSWSAALFVLHRCGPEPRPLDPMPFLKQLKAARAPGFADPFLNSRHMSTEFRSRGPFAKVCRPMSRPDADEKDVLWLLATHPEASAYIMAVAKDEEDEEDGDTPASKRMRTGSAEKESFSAHWLPKLLQERARQSERVTPDSLLSFDHGADMYRAEKKYDMAWLVKVCALVRATMNDLSKHERV
jgi:hypothetical protein